MKVVITIDGSEPVVLLVPTVPLASSGKSETTRPMPTEIEFLIGLDYIDSLVNVVGELFRCGLHNLDYGVEHRFRETMRHSRAYTDKWRGLLDGNVDRD